MHILGIRSALQKRFLGMRNPTSGCRHLGAETERQWPTQVCPCKLCFALKPKSNPAGAPCSYAFLADVYLPPLELLEGMVTHMAGMAAKRVPPAAAAAMLHYCTSLGVLPPAPASALFSYVHKCVSGPAGAAESGLGRNASRSSDNATVCSLAARAAMHPAVQAIACKSAAC